MKTRRLILIDIFAVMVAITILNKFIHLKGMILNLCVGWAIFTIVVAATVYFVGQHIKEE